VAIAVQEQRNLSKGPLPHRWKNKGRTAVRKTGRIVVGTLAEGLDIAPKLTGCCPRSVSCLEREDPFLLLSRQETVADS
jgi:hypothetical protein